MVQLPSQSKALDLREYTIFIRTQEHELYSLVLNFCRKKWPQLMLVAGGGRLKDGAILPRKATSYATVTAKGIKYGASTHTYGKNLCYAYIHARDAVRIDKIFSIAIPTFASPVVFALVRRFRPYKRREMPWSDW